MALVDAEIDPSTTHLVVDVRGELEVADVVSMPFYRRAKQ
jgi:hypothetical protein